MSRAEVQDGELQKLNTDKPYLKSVFLAPSAVFFGRKKP
jgi:hypothetical protein